MHADSAAVLKTDPPDGRVLQTRAIAGETHQEGDDQSEGPAPIAQHCSSVHGGEETECRGHTAVNLKQRRNVRLLASMNGVQEPNVEAMSFSEADQWIAREWRKWMEAK